MIIAGATSRGLTLSDLDRFTVGGLIDYVITWNSINTKQEKETVRKATQGDWDSWG